MAEKNIVMQRKNADGTFDKYYPVTKAANVKMEDGRDAETAIEDAYDLAEQAFQSASEQIKIKPNITILATGWVDDTATSGYWLYNIADADITADTVVDVNIHLAYLEKAESIKSANLSSVGKVTLYADEKPVENIVADLKLIRQVNV